MKRTSLIVFIIAIALILAGTGVGAAYVLTNKDAPQITQGGEPLTETLSFGNMVPGGEYVAEYTADGGAGSLFSARFSGGGEDTLAEFLTIDVVVDGETVFSGSYAECAETAVTKQVSGEFGFFVAFRLDVSVGDEAQGLACEITAEYALEGASAE